MPDQHMKEENSGQPQQREISEHEMNLLMSQLENEQNLQAAVAGGLVAALVSAVLWTVVTAATGYQIGFMALGVGFLVGYTVRFLGKGVDKSFGIVGALFSLLGCLGGNFFSVVYFVSVNEGMSFWEVLSAIDLSTVYSLMIETFDPMDLLFYGIAIYEGYRLSFREITDEDMAKARQY